MRSFERSYVFELCFILKYLITNTSISKIQKYFKYFEMFYLSYIFYVKCIVDIRGELPKNYVTEIFELFDICLKGF